MSDGVPNGDFQRIVRELEISSQGDAKRFLHDLLDFIVDEKETSKGWGEYVLRLGFRGRGLDSVDITDMQSIKFKPRDGS